jgi:hypothetical protein
MGFAGYPTIRLMALIETGTRAVLGAVLGSTGDRDEATLARRLLPLLQLSMLVWVRDRRPSSTAIRVLPTPAGPVSVTSLVLRSIWLTASSSAARPISGERHGYRRHRLVRSVVFAPLVSRPTTELWHYPHLLSLTAVRLVGMLRRDGPG